MKPDNLPSRFLLEHALFDNIAMPECLVEHMLMNKILQYNKIIAVGIRSIFSYSRVQNTTLFPKNVFIL